MNKVTQDFDLIANVEQERKWGHNNHYHSYLLSQIDQHNGQILDVGCGADDFCEQLAGRALHVTGIDLSANMIAKAQLNTRQWPNISYQVGDYLTVDYIPNKFDYIFSIATVHHFSLADFAQKAKQELKLGGKICILDLCQFNSLADKLTESLAVPANWLLNAWHNNQAIPSQEEQKAWQEHQASDHYLTLDEVEAIATHHLPNATIKRRLFWRYSLVWEKPIN